MGLQRNCQVLFRFVTHLLDGSVKQGVLLEKSNVFKHSDGSFSINWDGLPKKVTPISDIEGMDYFCDVESYEVRQSSIEDVIRGYAEVTALKKEEQ